VAVWTTDEGLNGIAVHVANDRGEPLDAELRVALYRGHEVLVGEGRRELRLSAHETRALDVEALLGHFADAAWAYRFGPPQHDVVVASLERDGVPLSQAFRFPAGRPLERESADRLGLEAHATTGDDGVLRVTVRTRRLAYGVRVHAAGHVGDDDAFCLEPGGERTIALRPVADEASAAPASIDALNLDGRLPVRIAEPVR